MAFCLLYRPSDSADDDESSTGNSAEYSTIDFSSFLPPIYEAPVFQYPEKQAPQIQASLREVFRPPSLHEPIISEKQQKAGQNASKQDNIPQFQFLKQQPKPFEPAKYQESKKNFEDSQKRFQQVQQQEYQQRQQFKFQQQQQPEVLQRGIEQYNFNLLPQYLQEQIYQGRLATPATIYIVYVPSPAPVQEFTDHIAPEPPARLNLPQIKQNANPKPMLSSNFKADPPDQMMYSSVKSEGQFESKGPIAQGQKPYQPNYYSSLINHGSYQSKSSFRFGRKDSFDKRPASTHMYPVHPRSISKEDLKVIVENAHNYALYSQIKKPMQPPTSAQYFTRIYPVSGEQGQNKNPKSFLSKYNFIK